MPARVWDAKDGAVFLVTIAATGAVERNLLGFFKTGEIRATEAMQEHHGPRDSAEYRRPIRIGATLTTTNFVPGAGVGCGVPGATVDDTIQGSSLHLMLPVDGWAEGDAIPGATLYHVASDLVDGGTFEMDCYITDIGESLSDDPNEESLTFGSCGMPTYTP